MKGIIIACPKAETAGKLKKLFTENGYTITGICNSGAKALRLSKQMDGGVIICTYRLTDMVASDLSSLLPVDYDILILLKQGQVIEKYSTNILTLPVSVKKAELFNSIDMLMKTSSLYPLQGEEPVSISRSDSDKMEIEDAKKKLMEFYFMTENEAHRFVQKRSMDSGMKMAEVAKLILKEW